MCYIGQQSCRRGAVKLNLYVFFNLKSVYVLVFEKNQISAKYWILGVPT